MNKTIYPIDKFRSQEEYNDCREYLESLVDKCFIKKIPVTTPYEWSSTHEDWYYDPTEDIVWMLKEPDFPFLGFLKKK